MPPESLIEALGHYGPGGILAALVFFFYRKDNQLHEERWKGQSEMLMSVVKDNTAAITALTSQLNKP
ncbi:hypothetical protein LCGC14_0521090 [marine sediment metagenome]|uniref:Uncharacterized protein n=1 Tax=marine sediment metagenome TaxID=412755 RepID=A0A0F9UJX6_9ZZZZ